MQPHNIWGQVLMECNKGRTEMTEYLIDCCSVKINGKNGKGIMMLIYMNRDREELLNYRPVSLKCCMLSR